MARRGVGPESEAESVRFLGRRVTKVGPEVKHGLPEAWGPAEQGWGETHLGAGGFRLAQKGESAAGVRKENLDSSRLN